MDCFLAASIARWVGFADRAIEAAGFADRWDLALLIENALTNELADFVDLADLPDFVDLMLGLVSIVLATSLNKSSSPFDLNVLRKAATNPLLSSPSLLLSSIMSSIAHMFSNSILSPGLIFT